MSLHHYVISRSAHGKYYLYVILAAVYFMCPAAGNSYHKQFQTEHFQIRVIRRSCFLKDRPDGLILDPYNELIGWLYTIACILSMYTRKASSYLHGDQIRLSEALSMLGF